MYRVVDPAHYAGVDSAMMFKIGIAGMVGFTTIFAVLFIIGMTVLFNDDNPWGGWFTTVLFGSICTAVVSCFVAVFGLTQDE